MFALFRRKKKTPSFTHTPPVQPAKDISTLKKKLTGPGVAQLRSDQAFLKMLAKARAEKVTTREGIEGSLSHRVIEVQKDKTVFEPAVVNTPAQMFASNSAIQLRNQINLEKQRQLNREVSGIMQKARTILRNLPLNLSKVTALNEELIDALETKEVNSLVRLADFIQSANKQAGESDEMKSLALEVKKLERMVAKIEALFIAMSKGVDIKPIVSKILTLEGARGLDDAKAKERNKATLYYILAAFLGSKKEKGQEKLRIEIAKILK